MATSKFRSYAMSGDLTSLQKGVAILSVGNTHAAVSTGQYVYVRDHGTLSDGLYRAKENIAANGTLSTSNVSSLSSGGLNALWSIINNLLTPTETSTDLNDLGTGVWWAVGSVGHMPVASVCIIVCLRYSSGGSDQCIQLAFRRTSDVTYIRRCNNGVWADWKQIAYVT